jgi:hypothetical protein
MLGGTLAGSALLTSIGVAYAVNPDSTLPPPEPVGWFLAAMSFVGAALLGAAGAWQWKAAGGTRVFFLVWGAVLAAIWIVASVLAILTYEEGPPAIPTGMHWSGLAISSGLFLAFLIEAWRGVAELQTRPG